VSQSASVWLVLVAALLAANLPFLNNRLFGLVPLGTARKLLAVRLGELLILYFLVGGLGLLFERRVGQIAPQGWEFYAVSGSLFLVLASPGFIWRYLIKHHRN